MEKNKKQILSPIKKDIKLPFNFEKKKNNTILDNENIIIRHNNNWRSDISIEKKDYYSFEEMLALLDKIDNAWEKKDNDTYLYIN